MPANLYYQVAVPSPLRRLFDYLPPAKDPTSLLPPGVRVRVPFGRRTAIGMIVAHSNSSALADHQLKHIAEVLDRSALLSPTLLGVCRWAADYYQTPVGEALATVLPALLRQGAALPVRTEQRWRLTTHGLGLPPDALRRAPRQQRLLQLLQPGDGEPAQRSTEALTQVGVSRATLRLVAGKGLIEAMTVVVATHSAQTGAQVAFDAAELLAEDPLELYPEQQTALAAIELHGYHSYLLQGETGSGKTEVYLQAIEKILRYGRQALVLVPEIGLTPQTLRRFRQRFRCPVAALHSGLTDRERLQAWQDAASGRAGVVIGTRSAVFTPLLRPGILIVDEEHDASFKQQDGFRYSARDVAILRASREGIPIVLGSATPSLESLHNCAQGRHRRLSLRSRPGTARAPDWQLVDMRRLNFRGGFSTPMLTAIKRELDGGNQVLVLLNRRGFAPTLRCHDCGWIANCVRCTSRLTVHHTSPGLLCHHCEYREAIPDQCPLCFSAHLQHLGHGTQRGETVLAALFPDVPIIRVDRDSTRRKTAMTQVVDAVERGAPCILVGTQMLAKGHHFPGVTLVAIVDGDHGLFSADFRATERMGQLIVQVAGRAGRGDRPGTVVLQSHHCDHPLVTTLTQQGYPAFAKLLLAARQLAALPPFRALALVRAEAETPTLAAELLRQCREFCQGLYPPSPHLGYLGPLPAPLEKRAGRYRYQFAITADSRPQLQQLLTRASHFLEELALARKLRWSIDVDPQDTL